MTVKLTVAKVRCNRVIPAAAPGMSEMVEFGAVYSSDPNHENKQWAQWTPSLSLQIAIDNPNAQGKFKFALG